MTLLETLRALTQPAERGAAASAVLAELRGLGAHLRGRYSEDVIDEAIQRVATNLVVRSAGRSAPMRFDTTGAARSYLYTALKNAALDLIRAMRSDSRRSLEEIEPAALVCIPAEEPWDVERAREQARALLDAPFATALSRRAHRYREGAERDYRDLLDLSLEGIPFEDVLQRSEGIGPGAGRQAHTDAANRVYKRHERLRRELHEAVDTLEAEGTLTPEETRVTRAVLQLLYRCQRKMAPDVSPSSPTEGGHR